MRYAALQSPAGPASIFLFVEGALLILFGLAALVFPLMAGAAAAVLLGWILIACGFVGLASAVAGREHVPLWWSLVSSLLALIAGVIIATHPLIGAAVLITLVVVWLVFDGVSSLMIALDRRRRGRSAWGWLLVSALVDWLLAASVCLFGPVFGLLAVGVIVGVDLVMGGAALLALAPAVRRQA